MKKIPLHGKRGEGKFALVDDQDYELASKYSWWVSADGHVRTTLYLGGGRAHARHKLLGLHQLIMNAPPGMVVDHKHGNPLDNRRSELRVCTNQQNGHNRRAGRNNTSGYKGVSFHKATGKWQASIRREWRSVHLGVFNTAEEAARAYNEAAIDYHGEFAHVNTIPAP